MVEYSVTNGMVRVRFPMSAEAFGKASWRSGSAFGS